MVAYVRRRGSRESCCISERGDQGMYRRLYPWMFLLGGVLIGVVISGRMAVRAQERSKPPAEKPDRAPLVGGAIAPPVGCSRSGCGRVAPESRYTSRRARVGPGRSPAPLPVPVQPTDDASHRSVSI